ncbi:MULTISPECIES: cell wall hydrolase [unclassified Sphingomonas]|uniref:cell wall hydrolase n=1 Tax=unclassified Sphingomonas TaxID=196159 RepID=UPI00215076F8|nr:MULTISPECIES: cell wall hydrolase [unclassified Sphingomonas]MCR5871380.1 cell wall hydrolase [Sphingomonas sp. J344]UUY00320.1 cell wall hydrolase [Sphingomonas sp. J315]
MTRIQLRGLAAALIASLIGAGFSAHAGLTALHASEQGAQRAGPEPTGYEADDHFPGAAFYQLADDDAIGAPTQGATGTVELPDTPVPEGAAVDPTIRPAPPFELRGSAQDKARALQCLTTAIYYEAATEPDDGQRAVAQVILNRARHPTFPGTICGVVFQGSEKPGCQFSFACDGSMARKPSRAHWDRAARVASAALAGGVFAPVGMATHYHTHAVTPSWNKSLVMTGVFGAHFFHRWKGYWGTGAAFTRSYRGGEPMPGPKMQVAAMSATPTAKPSPVATPVATVGAVQRPGNPLLRPTPAVPMPKIERPAPRRDEAESGDPLPRYAEPADSQVLDRWKDSGKPIR